MPLNFLVTTLTPPVRAAQAHYYGRAPKLPPAPETDTLTTEETDFLAAIFCFAAFPPVMNWNQRMKLPSALSPVGDIGVSTTVNAG